MWKCHKCGKPVYFAERKQSLGYDWHPECLRCEECGKRLNPGQHAEHKGVPYCHVPCYGALFGPQLFGHGTRVESHKSFGQQRETFKVGNGPTIPRSHVEDKLKNYNQYFDGKSGEIRSREVNGRLILEGALRVHWGIQGVIHLKEDDDQRTVVTVRKRNSCRLQSNADFDSDDDLTGISRDSSFNDFSVTSTNSNLDLDISISSLNLDNISLSDTGIESGGETSETNTVETSPVSPQHDILIKSSTLPPKLDLKSMEWDELDDLLQIERKVDNSCKLYQTMPIPLPSQHSESASTNNCENGIDTTNSEAKSECDGGSNDAHNIDSCDNNWIEKSNHLNRSMSGPDCLERMRQTKSPEFDQISINSTNTDISNFTCQDDVVIRRPPKTGSTAIKRRPGKRLSRTKLKRRCSINGHFYNRETSFFTPPHGSQMSVWITSLVSTQDVINLILEKYKVESDPVNFALFIVHDNGEQRRLKDDDYPLLERVLQGPHEDVVRLFLMDGHSTPEVSNEVAQFLNFSLAEMRAILNQYYVQEEREIARIQDKWFEMKRRIKIRMEELKVRL
ncbi:hypothetical protein PPYR_06402 [Photinus pyralis]|uniref:Ras-associating domain-containing protein n=1 Tax=Photinus pyralis TaxID=7054 RepID=A0A1Y1MVE0_PHOPY|nr:ras association domain-containing protein 4 [Photinus pyralis]KAB0800663.1 hypothetical protein PPYR_06402 [Photinus pyralis]